MILSHLNKNLFLIAIGIWTSIFVSFWIKAEENVSYLEALDRAEGEESFKNQLLELLKKECEQKNSKACTNYARYRFLWKPRERKEALKLLRHTCLEEENSHACADLGEIAFKGYVNNIDFMNLFDRACQNQEARACRWKGMINYWHWTSKALPQEGLEALKQGCALEDAISCQHLKWASEKDPSLFEYFKARSFRGWLRFQIGLGWIFLNPSNNPSDAMFFETFHLRGECLGFVWEFAPLFWKGGHPIEKNLALMGLGLSPWSLGWIDEIGPQFKLGWTWFEPVVIYRIYMSNTPGFSMQSLSLGNRMGIALRTPKVGWRMGIEVNYEFPLHDLQKGWSLLSFVELGHAYFN